jgi:hypothetical protein
MESPLLRRHFPIIITYINFVGAAAIMRIAIFILALAVSTPAFAADPPKPAPKPGEGKDKMICRREVPIGSLIASRKVCLTKEQWTARQRDGNEEARRVVEQGVGRCVGAGSNC